MTKKRQPRKTRPKPRMRRERPHPLTHRASRLPWGTRVLLESNAGPAGETVLRGDVCGRFGLCRLHSVARRFGLEQDLIFHRLQRGRCSRCGHRGGSPTNQRFNGGSSLDLRNVRLYPALLEGRRSQVVLFSVCFPIKRFVKFAKCRHFTRLRISAASFPISKCGSIPIACSITPDDAIAFTPGSC